MLRSILNRLRPRDPGLPFPPRAGQLVSVLTDGGEFGVLKLLAVDAEGVHGRLYVQRFASRPSMAEIGELSVAPFGPEHDHPFSIGHMPLSHGTFAGWQPVPLGEQPVTEDELEGYRMWEEANAGYF